MIEEPFRWVEAIQNRREYIESQLAPGSPIVCLSYRDGILCFTLGRDHQKIFEIYDRIAMGAMGHPGDIERLRMAAIELASTEGFTRSVQDVSLRRLANYALSPALKAAFEQVYGPPYLARMIFAELGRGGDPNLFYRIDYDGSIHTNGGTLGKAHENFGVIAGSAQATAAMEKFLRTQNVVDAELAAALRVALSAWIVGSLAHSESENTEIPGADEIAAKSKEQLALATPEAAVLEKNSSPICFRALAAAELDSLNTAT